MIFYGASGHAKVVIESWIASGGKVSEIFDDNDAIKSLLDYKVSAPFDETKVDSQSVVISIGYNSVRKKIADRLKVNYGKVIHPRSVISPSASVAAGTVVMANVAVNAATAIGRHCIINTSASIDHDCLIEDFVHIAPGSVLCGNVTVGEGTFIGAGAIVLPGITIGRWAIIGAGSVVTRNVGDSITVAGNPAKPLALK